MWSEAVSWSPRAFVFHNFLTTEVRQPSAPCMMLHPSVLPMPSWRQQTAKQTSVRCCGAGVQASDCAGHAAHGEVRGRRQRYREKRRQQVCPACVAYLNKHPMRHSSCSTAFGMLHCRAPYVEHCTVGVSWLVGCGSAQHAVHANLPRRWSEPVAQLSKGFAAGCLALRS